LKKLLLIVAVAILALTLIPLAAAQPGHAGWQHGKAKFNLVGKVTAVDTTSGKVTIDVKAGTKSVRSIRHQQYQMALGENAKIVWIGKDGKRQVIELADVQVGAKVEARGTVSWTTDDPPVLVVTINSLKVRQPLPVPAAG
jgi:hypothetical protein